MNQFTLRSIAFTETRERIAMFDFVVRNQSGEAVLTIGVQTRHAGEVNGPDRTTIDDVDGVGEARRKVHDVAIRLAAQMKDWGVP